MNLNLAIDPNIDVAALLGHTDRNLKLLRELLANSKAWEEVSFDDPAKAPISYAHPAQAM